MLQPKQLYKPINFYSGYMRRVYGERIQKISIEAGFTCPNRDGKVAHGGCTYCNNESFSPMLGKQLSIQEQISHSITHLTKRYKVNKFIAYFQSYSNTYAPLEKLKHLYSEALSHPQIIGLAIGTRPDCVDDKILDYIADLATEYDITLEYGLESMSDRTLKQINRGHDFNCFVTALKESQKRNLKVCTHLIIGLPGEDLSHWVKTAQTLSELKIDFLKLHQLHIVKNTVMAYQYQQHPWHLLSEEEYIEILIPFLEHLDNRIVIQRLFGQAPSDLLVEHNTSHSLSQLRQLIEKRMDEKNTFQGKALILEK